MKNRSMRRKPAQPLDRFRLARTIAELYLSGLVREEIDSNGTPRFCLVPASSCPTQGKPLVFSTQSITLS
jgi:hypothetical protein